jgi:hypothetical protein
MILQLALPAVLLSCGPGGAHDLWADGTHVPTWVKRACCGSDDARHLRPEQVHRVSAEYYEVDGYFRPIPAREAQPSEDGDYWIFYKNNKSGSQTGVFCFFVPMNE